MSIKSNITYFVIFAVALFFTYKNWFLHGVIIGGDWPYFYEEGVKQFTLFPPSWSYVHGNGFGGSILSYSIDSYLYATGFLFTKILSIPWEITVKIFWFFVFLLVGTVSSVKLYRTIFPDSDLRFQLLSAAIYLINTYILMVVSGGQMGVALSYAILPFFFASFVDLFRNNKNWSLRQNLSGSIMLAVSYSLVLLFDLRIAYVSIVGVAIYFLILVFFNKDKKNITIRDLARTKFLLIFIAIPLATTLLLHAFWLLPFYFIRPIDNALLGISTDVASSLRFFSFANFSDSLSLLQPNWPENIFGKTYFLRPEFLLYPILAYSALLFVPRFIKSKERDNTLPILTFLLIAVVGAFLAKGTKDPFGGSYIWLFQTIPGFVMFRDPTKWYTLVALSYAIVIPFSIMQVVTFLKSNRRFRAYYPYSLYILSMLLVSIFLYQFRPALQELPGTFRQRTVPKEYKDFMEMTLSDKKFYRTLLVPKSQRFVMPVRNHPAVEAYPFFQAKNTADLLRKLSLPSAKEKLQIAGIKYVVIPYDTFGELFLSDRKYSEKERARFEKQLDTLPWLEKIQDGKLTTYKTRSYNELFSLCGKGKITYFPVDGNYKVVIAIKEPTDILFSQNYSPYWIAKDKNLSIKAEKTDDGFIKFHIAKPDMYALDVVYEADKYYLYGRIISLTTLFAVFIGFLVLKLKKS